MSYGEIGLTERELHLGRYRAQPAAEGKSREQARAELAMAIRDGELEAPGDSGKKLNELFPQRYANRAASAPQGVDYAATASGRTAH
jgi:hypothetical protein